MLVFGSRALRYHFPQFREPRDWDLAGTRADVERLDQVLPRRGHQAPVKVHFEYDSATVEVDIAEERPFWARAMHVFRDAPTLEESVLGPLRVPPPAFLLFTKQCALIYGVRHWHKNLEDLYHLQQWIGAPNHASSGATEARRAAPAHPERAAGSLALFWRQQLPRDRGDDPGDVG